MVKTWMIWIPVAWGYAAQAPAAENIMGRNLAAGCAACHGTNGRSVAGTPVLAGMEREELVRQLQAFRDGKRQGTIMFRLAKGYTDAEIAAMADYFTAQARQ